MTLGFELWPSRERYGSVCLQGVRAGSKIFVLTSSFKDERAERAWRQLQDVFGMMKLGDFGVELQRLVIDLEDFTSAVLRVRGFFSRNSRIN